MCNIAPAIELIWTMANKLWSFDEFCRSHFKHLAIFNQEKMAAHLTSSDKLICTHVEKP